jgi:hypothetical protein
MSTWFSVDVGFVALNKAIDLTISSCRVLPGIRGAVFAEFEHDILRERFKTRLFEQLTELVELHIRQAALTLLASPARMFLQSVKTLFDVQRHPTTEALFIDKENVCRLAISIAFGN